MNATDAQQERLRERIKEAFFQAGDRVKRPVITVLNSVYPMQKRLQNSPHYDSELAQEHDIKFRRANSILYEQRNLVIRKHLPRYAIRAVAGDDSKASVEMRALICDNALDRVYENLIAYLPILVPADHARNVMETVKGVFDIEYRKLSAEMNKFSATFAPGVIALDEDM